MFLLNWALAHLGANGWEPKARGKHEKTSPIAFSVFSNSTQFWGDFGGACVTAKYGRSTAKYSRSTAKYSRTTDASRSRHGPLVFPNVFSLFFSWTLSNCDCPQPWNRSRTKGWLCTHENHIGKIEALISSKKIAQCLVDSTSCCVFPMCGWAPTSWGTEHQSIESVNWFFHELNQGQMRLSQSRPSWNTGTKFPRSLSARKKSRMAPRSAIIQSRSWASAWAALVRERMVTKSEKVG